MQKIKRKTLTPAVKKASPSSAWLEGYVEGRTQSGIRAIKNPHVGAAADEWQEGYTRGVTCRHYIEETPSADVKINHAVMEIRRAKGERV